MTRRFAVYALSLLVAAGALAARAMAGPQESAPAASEAKPQSSAQPPRPFPEDARVGYIDLNVIAQQSAQGRAATKRIQDLQAKKRAELEPQQKELAEAQQKLQQGASVMNPSALDELRKRVEKLQLDLQYQAQMANNEVTNLATDLHDQLQQKMLPVIEKVATSKGLHVVLNRDTVVWVDRGVDITQDVIKALDAGGASQ